MCSKELLIGYIYDELSAAERATFETHLITCVDCRDEIDDLRQARSHLSSWAPPEPALDFQVIRGPVAAPRRPLAFVPQWALAAAAAVLLAAGAAAIAHVEVQYGPQGVTVRSGWGSPAAATAVPAAPAAAEPVPAAVPTAASEQLIADVAALQQRLHQLEETQTKQAALVAALGRPGITVPELRKVLTESEARQRTELAVQVAQMWKDIQVARASDIARVQDVINRTQGYTNTQLRQHRDSIESLYRVSAQR